MGGWGQKGDMSKKKGPYKVKGGNLRAKEKCISCSATLALLPRSPIYNICLLLGPHTWPSLPTPPHRRQHHHHSSASTILTNSSLLPQAPHNQELPTALDSASADGHKYQPLTWQSPVLSGWIFLPVLPKSFKRSESRFFPVVI